VAEFVRVLDVGERIEDDCQQCLAVRLLLTGEPVDHSFLEGIVDVVVDGVARRRGRG
jgi:hypothetical protein